MGQKIYTLKELSNNLDMDIRALREYIKLGKLSAHKKGRSYVVTPEALDDFIRSNVVISTFGIGKG